MKFKQAPKIPSLLIEFVWRNRLFDTQRLELYDGTIIQVVDPGVRREGVQAEFCNAAIYYPDKDITYHGNVKVNLLSSDWRAEGTISDPSMSAVILHVVLQRDTTLLRGDHVINTLELPINHAIANLYTELYEGGERSRSERCAPFLLDMNPMLRHDILSRLASDRLHRKSEEMHNILKSVSGSWAECSYICLMCSFGYGKQKEAFERLARAIPFQYIAAHADNRQWIEAVLLGCAGYLDITNPDNYTIQLIDMWHSFRRDSRLLPPAMSWAAGVPTRTMPANQIVRAAAVLHRMRSVLDTTLSIETVFDALSLLDAPVSEYWYSHSQPSVSSSLTSPSMTIEKKNLLIINYIIPFLNIYGTLNFRDEMRELALDLSFKAAAETNSKVDKWKRHAIPVTSAFESQAFIQLSTVYCDTRRCAECPICERQLYAVARFGG